VAPPQLLADVLRSPELLAAVDVELGEQDAPSAAAISRLRRRWPAELVAGALSQVQLRRRAVAKFGAAAGRMALTPNGLEQASRPAVAALRARRFAEALADRPDTRPVADLCCGIGADLAELARVVPPGRSVYGVDRDPDAVLCARHNAAVLLPERPADGLPAPEGRQPDPWLQVRCADVTTIDPAEFGALFVDPSRRSAQGRRFDPEGYSPPLSFVRALARLVPLVGAKVAPGLPHDAIPDGAEAQWVSWRGALKETALWFGPLRSAARRATLLPGGHTLTERDLPGDALPPGPIGSFVYEPDAAVIRAGLVTAVGAMLPGGRLIDPHLAYLTADGPADTPFAAGFAVQEVLPYSPRRLREALHARRIGVVEIKVRGLSVDPAKLRPQLKLSGDESCTVLLARRDSGPIAIIAQRLPARPSSG